MADIIRPIEPLRFFQTFIPGNHSFFKRSNVRFVFSFMSTLQFFSMFQRPFFPLIPRRNTKSKFIAHNSRVAFFKFCFWRKVNLKKATRELRSEEHTSEL